MKDTWRFAFALLLIWFIVLIYMSHFLYISSNGELDSKSADKLVKALQQLELLKEKNEKLHALATELREIQEKILLERGKKKEETAPDNYENAENKAAPFDQHEFEQLKAQLDRTKLQLLVLQAGSLPQNCTCAPSIEHERYRRRVTNGIKEMWYYLNAELSSLQKYGNKPEKINLIMQQSSDHAHTILADLERLSQSSNANIWRKKEAVALSELVQSRLEWLQNPTDCSTAKKLVCNLSKGCGYGCQIHHLVYCLMLAYGTERTLILESGGWRYSPDGWEKVFQPLSKTCTRRSGSSRSWGTKESIEHIQTVELPIIDSLHPRPPFLPLAIPADLAPRLKRLHGSPIVWWVGQLVKYLLRPQPSTMDLMKETSDELGFKRPIVGVHVRRSDKVGTEASFHSLEEYMVHVDQYYLYLEKLEKVDQRRVFLATDEPLLLAEAKIKYPHYQFLSENSFSRSASLSSRYTDMSLRGIILDIHFLSLTDYLVCTFSSQVCRLAYEIMQSLHADASDRFHSLDDIYYYGGQNAHNQVAMWSYEAQDSNQFSMQVGDVIGIAGNHWNGFSKGINRRTGAGGFYPSYKVEDKVEVAAFPKYEQVHTDS